MAGSESPDELARMACDARRDHRLDLAARLQNAVVDAYRRYGDDSALAGALVELGRIERDRHQIETAANCYSEAAELYRHQPDPTELAHALRHLADLRRELGQYELAESCCVEAISICRGDPRGSTLPLANALRILALLKEQAADRSAANALWGEARDPYAAASVDEGVRECSMRLGG